MVNKLENPFKVSEEELTSFLLSSPPPFPELQDVIRQPNKLIERPQTKIILEMTKGLIRTLKKIPELSPALYRSFAETGKREPYVQPYDARRTNLSVAVLLYLLGQKELLPIIEEYLLAICNEDTWVVPFHEGRIIDLWATDTALTLAEIVSVIGKDLATTTIQKVRQTIDENIFEPYLNPTVEHAWYKRSDNWNSVCNSQIASTFLLLENDIGRKVHAIKRALDSLQVYIDTGFNEDGSTSEGIIYWNYGMSSLVIFSEMLRAATGQKIDLLKHSKITTIAAYPSKIQLSPGMFASFSDAYESDIYFNPGIIQRLAERTGEYSLFNLLAKPLEPDYLGITVILRYILWWDGKKHDSVLFPDSILPSVGIARLTGKTPRGTSLTVVIKAGHNDENHNHNDVGSFILNVAGENLITDPGTGLYTKDYFSPKRYDNIFTNSYGHSVPRINHLLQSTGKDFFGELIGSTLNEKVKQATVEFNHAYAVPSLTQARRTLSLLNERETSILLEDYFQFSNQSPEIEEVFITWCDVDVKGHKAIIKGKNHQLQLTIEKPSSEVRFQVENLAKESKENNKADILKRLTLMISPTQNEEVIIRIRMQLN